MKEWQCAVIASIILFVNGAAFAVEIGNDHYIEAISIAIVAAFLVCATSRRIYWRQKLLETQHRIIQEVRNKYFPSSTE